MTHKKLKYWFDKDLAVLPAEKNQKVYGLFDSIGMEIIKKWPKDATRNRKWIIRHALRNEVKKKQP